MTQYIGSGAVFGLSIVAMSIFVLAVTAFHGPARDSDTWKALATAIILTGLMEFSSFVQQALLKREEAKVEAPRDPVLANDEKAISDE